MRDPGHPLDWHYSAFWTLVAIGLVVAYVLANRRQAVRPTGRQVACFALCLCCLLGAVSWPLGNLAAHWSLLALVLQRLLLMLAVPPLLVAGTPDQLLVSVTRPAVIDGALRQATRPLLAIVFVTVVAVGTLSTGAVSLATSSAAGRVGFEALILVAGFVLWAPVLRRLPGTHHLSSLAAVGYLIVQSIVPSFLSIVWIFARRPLYRAYDHQHFAGMSPLLDQQLAGFAAKLGTIAVLWVVAFVIMSRAQGDERRDDMDPPLVWSDVEREIERAERKGRWSKWAPPSNR